MATLARVDAYYGVAKNKIYWLPTITDTAGLVYTRAELTAGTEISADISEIEGWTVSGTQIETPKYGDLFTSKIPGRTESEDSSFTFYADENSQDVRTVFTRGDRGYMVFMYGGDVPTNLSAVFPAQVTAVSMMLSAGEDADRVQVGFAITAEPQEAVVIPATV